MNYYFTKIRKSKNNEKFLKSSTRPKQKLKSSLEKHNELWIKINDDMEDSKGSSFDMIDFIQSKNDLILFRELDNW